MSSLLGGLLHMVRVTALAVIGGLVLAAPDGSGAVALALFVAAGACSNGAYRTTLCVAVVAGLIGSGLGWYHHNTVPEDSIRGQVGAEALPVTVVAQVGDEPQIRRVLSPPMAWGAVSLDLEQRITGAAVQQVSGRVRGYLWDIEAAEGLRYGDRVELSGELALPRAPTNPGQFDWPGYCRHQGFEAVLSVPRGEEVVVLSRDGGEPLWRAAMDLRRWLSHRVRTVVPGDRGDLLAALLFGDRDHISDDHWQRFAESGTLHLLAISGLHLALVIAMLGWFLRRVLQLPLRVVYVLVLCLAVFYCMVTGARPAVVRATVMVVVHVLGLLCYRQASVLNSLAIAAIVIVAWSPASVFSAGFQLSFMAVLGLVVVAKPLCERWGTWVRATRLQRWGRWAPATVAYIGDGLIVSVVAWVATAPLVAFHFNLLTPLAVLINVPAVAVVTVLIAAGLTVVIVSVLHSGVATVLGMGVGWLLGILLGGVGSSASVRALVLYLPAPTVAQLVCGYGVLAVGLWFGSAAWLQGQLSGLRRWQRCSIQFGLAVGLFMATAVVLRPSAPESVPDASAVVRVLDVSNGSAVVAETPAGAVVFDCGSRRLHAGSRYIAPALWLAGHSAIHTLFLSHADWDHVSALMELLDRFTVGQVVVGRPFGGTRSGAELLAKVRARGVRCVDVEVGWRLGLGRGVAVEVLAAGPAVDSSGAVERWSTNDGSVVLMLRAGGASVLLPGDIEERGVDALISAHGDLLAADVVVLPHHGRDNGRVRVLATSTTPRWAIASAGEGVLVPGVAAAFEAVGAEVLSTAEAGCVTVLLAEGEVTVQRWLEPE